VPFDAEEGTQTKILSIPNIDETTELVIRNFDPTGAGATAEIERIELYSGFDGRLRQDPNYRLADVTAQPIEAKAARRAPFTFGSIATTEVCNLSCVMCHFNGPKALKKGRILKPETVERILDQIPRGEKFGLPLPASFSSVPTPSST
jgi:sulfatase maturation enzyme AslB (radical SAM superfamily)